MSKMTRICVRILPEDHETMKEVSAMQGIEYNLHFRRVINAYCNQLRANAARHIDRIAPPVKIENREAIHIVEPENV